MDRGLMVLGAFALAISVWFGLDAYLRIRAAARGVAPSCAAPMSARHAYTIVACRLAVALGVPAFVVAYGFGADAIWVIAGPAVLLVCSGLLEWTVTQWVERRVRPTPSQVR